MITKQQALEFLYELSQKYEVTINSYLGKLSIKGFHSEDIEFDTPAIDKGLEGAVQQLIKQYPFIAEKVTDKIPVDIDMLEVGEIYEVHDSYCDGFDNWITSKFTSKFLSLGEFNPNGYYNINFEDGYVNTLHYIEMYKVAK